MERNDHLDSNLRNKAVLRNERTIKLMRALFELKLQTATLTNGAGWSVWRAFKVPN